jgi:predicted nucleic acid-binding protein
MRDKGFVDTNVLVYLFGIVKGSQFAERTAVAEELVAGGATISVQVLNEFVQVCRRKAGLDWDKITSRLELIKQICEPPVPLTLDMHDEAISIARRYKFHFYDSLIIAAATQAGCTVLYSEDLQHGQKIGNLRIENPFLGRAR